MDSKMFASIGFPVCSLFFLLFILIMYLNKKKYKNVENSVFRFLLIHSFLCVLFEVLYVYFLSVDSASDFIKILFCKLFLVIMIAWILLYVTYIEVLITKKYETSIKKLKRKKMMIVSIILQVIATILIIVFSIQFENINNLYVFNGDASNVAYAFGGFGIILSVYAFGIRNDIVNGSQKFTMMSAVAFVIITLVIQFIIPSLDFNIQNFQFTMLLLALFFTLENQDNRLLKEHEEQKREAEEANKIQTEFLTSMSHEIRTPMNTIIGFSDVLISENASNEENVKTDVRLIHNASTNLLDLINNILDLSRIESGQEVLFEKEYDLQSFIIELDASIKNRIGNKNIEYSLLINNDLPKVLFGDVVKISKVVSNLMFNVIDYTREGKVQLDISFSKINETEDNIVFNITSSGSEINDNEYNNYYLKDVDTNNVNSVILEYNIAKIYSGFVNGSLKMTNDNRFNVGYYFEVIQNVVNPSPLGDMNAQLRNIEQSVSYDFAGRNILVVDDNAVNIKLIERFLTEMNITVDKASSGKECIDKVLNNKYDLVFLDHLMPVMDGVETLNKLKDLTNNLPPIIALTANSYTGIREEYINLGFNDYVSKPVNRIDIGKVLYMYIKK